MRWLGRWIGSWIGDWLGTESVEAPKKSGGTWPPRVFLVQDTEARRQQAITVGAPPQTYVRARSTNRTSASASGPDASASVSPRIAATGSGTGGRAAVFAECRPRKVSRGSATASSAVAGQAQPRAVCRPSAQVDRSAARPRFIDQMESEDLSDLVFALSGADLQADRDSLEAVLAGIVGGQIAPKQPKQHSTADRMARA